MNSNVEEYCNSLRDGREVYYRGKKVDDVTKHPILGLEVNLIKYYFDPNYYYDDSEFNKKILKFYKTPHSSSDLLERSTITYEITKEAGVLLPHIGSDAIHSARISTNNLEAKFKESFNNYADHVIRDNMFLAAAQIDVKGDRRLRPSKQEDSDMHVHVIDENSDGIIVRGAKMHTTFAAVANEIFVLPGRSFREGDEDYAVCFAVPANTEGLKLIARPAMGTEAALHDLEGPTCRKRRAGETTTIFEDVFVPWERVFVYKDIKVASGLALLFALWHRLSALSYRAGLAEHLIGLGKLVAEANGVDKVSHIRRDIVDLISFAEIQRMCARMAAYECHIDKKTGIAVPNHIYTNVGKLYSNEAYLNVIRSLIDIAGGIACTAPSGDDYANKELKQDISKYLAGAIAGEDRFKLMLILREKVALLGGEEAVIHIHAEGSMEASIIELYRSYDFTESERVIKNVLSEMK
jgi:4-hydroxybutyryl-CoA dehydratase/vinylacetyl-CoA-Delta-isomerase